MKVLLGLSGGVDSTYAALKLKKEGYEVEGAVLVMHEYTSVDEAKESAESLGIPLHVIDCTDAFERVVKSNFVSEYKNARTPNPCVICNSEIKFKFLHDYAKANGFDKIATGHYATVKKLSDSDGEYYAVARGLDYAKDQTYMLWRLPQNILRDLLLPLSDMKKEDIREDSKREGLAAADRKDSQEICFLPDGNYAEYIESVLGKCRSGNFIDESGNILGTHKGIIRYTVGQRRGLGISAESRLFVTDIDPLSNTVTLSKNDSFSDTVRISGIVYSGMRRPGAGETLSLSVKLRYAARAVEANVIFNSDSATVLLTSPQRAVTPGQSCVFYDGDLVVAGGFIEK